MMSIHLKIVGVLLLLLAAANFLLPRRLHWREELPRLSLLNRRIFQVHCMFIVLIVVMLAVLCLVYTDELQTPHPLARAVLAGMALFWALRLFAQWFIYDRSLWQGDRARTVLHVIFSLLWVYFVGVFGAAWWSI